MKPKPDVATPPPSNGSPAQPDALQLDVDDLQSAFDRLVATGETTEGTLELDPVTKREHAEMFAQMAIEHAAPIREFMMELSVAETTKQWIDVIRPSMQMLRRSAAMVNGDSYLAVLEVFDGALDGASKAQPTKIQGDERKKLLASYAALAEAMPAAFELGTERERRETILVHQLLLQVPGVHKVTTDRIYSAGVGALQKLCTATSSELDSVTGIGMDLADAVVAHFRAYWNERTRTAPDVAADMLKRRLKGSVDALSRAQDEFERAEQDEDQNRKRAARRERDAKTVEINIVLAQLGQVDFVRHLERCSIRGKVETLRHFIQTGEANFASASKERGMA